MGKNQRPNILWICTDQQRFDTLGCYGNRFVNTPNIDELAERGVLFENCFSQCTVCAPSRASFLTGRYPRTTRCRQNGQDIPEGEVLITKLLKRDGYVCGLSGKLHISACHPSVCKGTERRIDDGYDQFSWSHHPQFNWPTNEYSQWLQEKGLRYEAKALEECKYVFRGMPEQYHHTTWCTERAIGFIRGCAQTGQPWLFSLNYFDPHHRFDPPEEYLKRYLDKLDDIPLPNYVEGELESKPEWQSIDHQGAYGGRAGFNYEEMTDVDHRLLRAAYWAMVDLIDKQVGRLIKTLRETGQIDNTIIIFTSDHGEMLGDHGIYLKGAYFYEPAVHVPLIMSWPGVWPEGERSSALVELVDLAPTLSDAAGLGVHPGMQGRSLWPMLKGKSSLQEHRDTVYSEYYGASKYDAIEDGPVYATMVRSGRYKLVHAHGTDHGELYDLKKDPGENKNLWDNPDYREILHMMLMKLSDRMAWTVDPLPERSAIW